MCHSSAVEIVSSLNRSGYLFEKLVSHSNSLSYMCKNIVILSKVWGYMYLFFYPFKRLELSFPKKYLVSIPKEFRCQSFALSICFLRPCPHKSGQFFKPHIFFISVLVDGVLNCSGGQFQNNAILMIPTHKNQH